MHVLVFGDDEVALSIGQSLMGKHKVILLGPPGWHPPRLDKLDVETVEGSATNPETLALAQVKQCQVFISCSANDEQNIVACLAAKHEGAGRVICVLRRPGFFDAKEQDEDLAHYLGVDMVIRPSEQLAHEILRIVTVPGALDVEELAGGKVALLRYAVEEGAPITRFVLQNSPLPPDVVLCMVRRGEEVFIPQGDTAIQAGDKLTAMGTPPGVRMLRSGHLRSLSHAPEGRSACIIGGGVVGFVVASELERQGWTVKLVEMSRRRCREIAPRLPRTLVLNGDGTDIDLLEEEQVGECAVLVAVTDNDEKNLLVSMMARSLGVERIITRAGRLANERMFERVGIDVVRSAHGAAVRSVVRDVVDPRHEIRAELEHGDVHVVELELPEDFTPVRLADMRNDQLFAVIGAIVRGRTVLVPSGDTLLEAGDHLFLFCQTSDEDRACAFFRNPSRIEA